MKGIEPPTESFYVKTLLKGYTKQDVQLPGRKPISKKLLHKLLISIQSHISIDYEKLLLTSLFSLMYHSLLRISEVTESKYNNHNILFNQIKVNKRHTKLNITFKTFKHSTASIPIQVTSQNNGICPVASYLSYIHVRGSFRGPAFIRQDHTPLTRTYVKQHLDSALSFIGIAHPTYNTHSFRIGKATDMHSKGHSDSQIQLAGRWKSTAFKKYIKPVLVSL